MGNTAYCYEDYVKNATEITLTSEDSDNYPVANSQDEQVALTTRTTAKVSIKYQVEFASARQPKIFAILNHNFSGGTFDINSYTADDFTTGKVAVEANKAVRLLDVYHRETSAPTAQKYWELDLTNVTSADSYFEFGRVMMYSDVTQLLEPKDIERQRGYGYKNIINVTPYGTRWVHKLTKNVEQFQLNWSVRDNTNIPTEHRTLFETVYGDAHPFLFIPDLASTDCFYCYIDQPSLNWVEKRGESSSTLTTDVSIRFVEAVRGKVC